MVCRMSVDCPERAEDLTWRHKVVHYTLLPVIATGIMVISSTLPLFYIGAISFIHGIMVPYVILSMMFVYLLVFGEYVIPHGVYTDIRASG